MFQVETRNQFASALVAAMIFAQMLALGAENAFASAFFALAEILVCVALIAILNQGAMDRMWIELAPSMMLFFAAIFWAAAPLLMTAAPFLRGSILLAPDGARLELLKLAGIGAACLSGCLIGLSRSRLQHFIMDVALIGLAYTLLALWVGQASPVAVWGQPKGAHAFRFTGTFLNANAAGCVFGMMGLIGLGLLQSLMKRTDLRDAGLVSLVGLVLAGCGVMAAFAACILTQSRAALTVTVVLGAMVVVLEARRAARRGGGKTLNRVIMAAAGGLVLLGLGLGGAQISSRWSTLLADAQLRGEAYWRYFGAIARSPLFGYGLGGFKALHQSILTPDLAPAMWDFGAAHSALTQAALEGGLPFVLLLLAAISLMGWRILKIQPGRPRRGAVVTGVLAAVGLAFAISFVDIALNVPAIAAFALLLFGIAWGDAVARGLILRSPHDGRDDDLADHDPRRSQAAGGSFEPQDALETLKLEHSLRRTGARLGGTCSSRDWTRA